MRARLLIPLAALGVLAGGCGRCGGEKKDAPPAPRAVALVNGEPIGADVLARELRETRAGEAQADGGGDTLRRGLLDELVDRALLLQEARARSIVVGQDQVERAFLRVRAEYPGSNFDDLLAQQRLGQADLKGRLKDQLTIERLFEEQVFPQVQVADGEIQRYYADHAAEFEEPERVHVLQVVVSTKEEALAIRDRLRRNPQTFAEVARKSSIAPEGKAGGDLGFIGRGAGFPEVFDVTFSLPLNKVSDVTPSPYGFHVFKVIDRRAAARRSLDQARPEIAEKLTREKRARAQDDYLKALRERARIEIDEKALAGVNP
ncbi:MULTISPECIES: peptidyl-prolyl cis-trans isomerase [unclassified Anaeromyxobacter]|uniref:peptidylprolyl isomerase n=1 Tax=unclassified Anaeromyxobacter TaxID=2620896 RepID=UPI001F58D1B8|nr:MULTISPECIES: peptidyl-prolyl cis-trans isomerase [unclassified Anaeromyxobacter]